MCPKSRSTRSPDARAFSVHIPRRRRLDVQVDPAMVVPAMILDLMGLPADSHSWHFNSSATGRSHRGENDLAVKLVFTDFQALPGQMAVHPANSSVRYLSCAPC